MTVPRVPVAAALAAAVTLAGPSAAQQPAPPALVVHITVDQMRGDYLVRFRRQFTGGLARLTREGAVFTLAYQDHAMTETAPGHATVLSGRHPVSTGITRNAEGVGDGASPLLEVRGPGASPLRFRGTALLDWMQARWPEARALSVSRKDRGAILPVGRARQQVYWYEGGRFTTSTYYADSLPAWLRAYNERATAARRPGTVWDLLLPPEAYPEPDSMPFENRGRAFVFPYTLPDDTALAWRAFLNTPFLDSLTLDLALEGLRRLDLGRGPQPDLLAISLSATDYIGHAWGHGSREVHDQIVRLDRLLGRFLDSLFALRDPASIVISLTGDHGVTPYPEWSRLHGHPSAGYVRLDTLLLRYRRALQEPDSLTRGLFENDLGMLSVDRGPLEARGVNVDTLLVALRRDLRRVRGVRRVDTWPTLLAADTGRDDVARWWRNLASPDIGAELFITLRSGMYFDSVGYAMHGQPTVADAHVPLVLWGAPFRRVTVARRVSVVDIAPTLARVLGVTPLEPVHGRVLHEALRR